MLAWEDGWLPPTLDSGGENSTMAENLERVKQRIPLLEYLQRHNWKPCRAGTRQEFVGLCPLHPETRLSSTSTPLRICSIATAAAAVGI
jgi:hypothetical protein